VAQVEIQRQCEFGQIDRQRAGIGRHVHKEVGKGFSLNRTEDPLVIQQLIGSGHHPESGEGTGL